MSQLTVGLERVAPAAEEKIKSASRSALPNETGGLLLGYFTEAGIVIQDAIEVVDPHATPSRYTRRRVAAQDALDTATRDAPAYIGYVGDWHSHPAPVDASSLDVRTALRDAQQMHSPLALIVASVDESAVTLSLHVPAQVEFPSYGSTRFTIEDQTSGGRKGAQETVRRWWQVHAISVYLIIVGVLLIWAMGEAVEEDSAAAAASLAVLGGGALILAAFAPYVEGTLKLGTLEMNLRSRLIGAASRATNDELEAIVTILEDEDISVQEVELPSKYEGLRLTDEALQPMRKALQLSTIAVKSPGETKWKGGGRISEEPLQPGARLLLAGPRESIGRFMSE